MVNETLALASPRLPSAPRKTTFRPVRTLLFLALLFSTPLCAAENPILEWNAAVLRALKRDTSAPLLVARTLAMLHIALDRTERALPGNDVALHACGCTVAETLLPNHKADFEAIRARAFGEKPEAAAVTRGEQEARRILSERTDDGSSIHVSYVPSNEPGAWRRTPPFFRPPELPQWASRVKPFVIEKPDQFRPAAPPALDSPEWAKALAEIKQLGTVRTDEQTTIAKFWSDFSNTETPPGHWNSIARTLCHDRNFSTAASARLFATLNIALHDAGIACWDAKYHYNFWRPVTAIGPEWQPLLKTPAHPEYPSGHSAFSSAAAVVLAKALGTDALTFTVRSDALPRIERRFTSLRACAEECSTSRIYGGIHYRFSCEAGQKLGETVARWIGESAK